MKRKELTFVASWLFHNEKTNPVRQQINEILKPFGLHSTTEVPDHLFDHLISEIKRIQVQLKLEDAKFVRAAKRLKK